jgi:hypothetical protein
MKKVILLMLMLSPFANADMDYVCVINSPLLGKDDLYEFIFSNNKDVPSIKSAIDEQGCERNNILKIYLEIDEDEDTVDIADEYIDYASALWCRHDRNEKLDMNQLRCVLYDTKPRKLLN